MAVADKVGTVLTWSLQLRYQVLDRMRQIASISSGVATESRSIFGLAT